MPIRSIAALRQRWGRGLWVAAGIPLLLVLLAVPVYFGAFAAGNPSSHGYGYGGPPISVPAGPPYGAPPGPPYGVPPGPPSTVPPGPPYGVPPGPPISVPAGPPYGVPHGPPTTVSPY